MSHLRYFSCFCKMKFYLRSAEISPDSTLQDLANQGMCNLQADIAAYFKITFLPTAPDQQPKDEPEQWTKLGIRYKGLSATASNFFYEKTFQLKWALKKYMREIDIKCLCGQVFKIGDQEICSTDTINDLADKGVIEDITNVQILVNLKYVD